MAEPRARAGLVPVAVQTGSRVWGSLLAPPLLPMFPFSTATARLDSSTRTEVWERVARTWCEVSSF